MRLFLAVLLGKLIAFTTKFFKIGGGSAAPGLYALKICPSLVSDLSQHIPKNVVITGTNGKTTTARMIGHLAKNAGLKVIRNHTGSNLERGIASTLISNYTLHPRPYTLDLGIWELDEAAFNTVAPKLTPDIIVFLNVFRDQLDRYGEIDTLVKNWSQTLKKLPAETVVLVNSDDVNTAKLAKFFTGKVQKFGVEDYKIVGESIEHLKNSSHLDYEAKNVILNGLNGSTFTFSILNSQFSIDLPLPGLYHIYDALAAIACAYNLNLPTPIESGPTHRYTDTLKNFSPAFGRVERLPFGFIFLIKNPAGATQVFETLAPNIKPQDAILLALNDNLADGTDVSWIWDAQFEKLKIENGKWKIVCSGARAYDLAVRLKYAGIDPKRILIEPSLEKALQQARTNLKGHLFILPTYTAMLELQSILTKVGIKKHYWKEKE